MTLAHVPYPALTLRDDTLASDTFDDVYFSRAGGVAETEHVFLHGSGLPARWQLLGAGERFAVAELGFGTGLNFLVTSARFCACAPPGAVLHYHAVEQYPLSRHDLARVLALQPEIAAQADALCAAYPLRLPGPHRLVFPRAVLHVWWGEVGAWLPTLRAIDAWYLDGFAPAKNPDMWSDAVFAAMARSSAPNASFATFTAASAVRRGLQAVGFAVEKVAGFGRKREMLRGVCVARAPSAVQQKPPASVVILGAGIAGASLARSFAERGVTVTVLERQQVAAGASGNAAGVLFPPLSKFFSPATAFYFAAYASMLRHCARWRAEGLEFAMQSPGMLRLPRHALEEEMLRALPAAWGVDPEILRCCERAQASAQAGVELTSGGIYFPQGSWVNPAALCRVLLQHPRIMLREGAAANALAKTAEGWCVTLADGTSLYTPLLCVAAAYESAALLADYGLRLQQVGGQVSAFAVPDAAPMLRSILCRKGYVIPQGGHYLTGATYHREALLEVTQDRHGENMAELEAMLPGWSTGVAPFAGRSSIRTTTPDRLPLIGSLDAGLYVSLGHGSRGLLSGPMAAEMIVGQVLGEAAPVTPEMAAAVDARRFIR